MVDRCEIDSPTLQKLFESVNQGNSQEISSFWSQIERNGTPLIEDIEGFLTHKLVTFIVRNEPGIDRAAIACSLTGYSNTIKDTQLRLLPGTDILYRSVKARNGTRTMYQIGLNYNEEPAQIGSNWIRHAETWKPDPLNKHIQSMDLEKDGFGWADREFSTLELPDAFEDKYSSENEGVPKGERLEYSLEDAKIGQSRNVWAYLPPGYDKSTAYPLIVFTDGWLYYENMSAPTTLDNLIYEEKIPPVIAIFINHTPGNRSKELYCNEDFIDFVSTQFVGWFENEFSVSDSPNDRIVVGHAAGGFFASFLALHRPDLFGGVISTSASYWYRGSDNEEPGWVIRQYVEKEKQNIRFYIDIGTLEQDPAVDNGGNSNVISLHRHFRDVLRAKGYSVTYVEYEGGHDLNCWKANLPAAVMDLFSR
jgi:enterochelin esterase family protein